MTCQKLRTETTPITMKVVWKSSVFGSASAQCFMIADPLASKYPNMSPYNYCAGNPIRYLDSDGLFKKESQAVNYAKRNGGEAFFDNDTKEWVVGKQYSEITGSGNMMTWTIGMRITRSYSSGANSLVVHWIKSAFNAIEGIFKKIPEGTSNNYNDTPNSHVGEVVEILSSDKVPGNNSMPLSSGSSKSIIETGDMLVPSEGDNLGPLSNESSAISRWLYNGGNALNNGSSAVEAATPERRDTIIKGKDGWFGHYDKELLNEGFYDK